MTKQELLKILDEKIKDAEKESYELYEKAKRKIGLYEAGGFIQYKQLQAKVEAYTDILNLIESSGELDDR